MIIFIYILQIFDSEMFKCPKCYFKSNKAEVQTTEIGAIRWLNATMNENEEINLGNKWEYKGGETLEEKGYSILCKKCGEVIKEIEKTNPIHHPKVLYSRA